jgi:peptide/nickel transport system substrate-binding protein
MMTRMPMRRALAGLLAGFSVLATTAAMAQDACQPGGTLRMARDAEPNSVVPWQSTGNGGIFLQIQIYDRLVEQMPGAEEVQPGLAESWEISDDGMTYTFNLRDAMFSDGTPVTVEDVKFSLDRVIDESVQADWAFLMQNVAGFTVVDDDTIAMNMSAPDASILYSLSLPAGAIYSKAAFDRLGAEGFAEAPVGSGAFMVKSWTRGERLEIVRNPYYWREGQPILDGVTFDLVRDANARILKLQAGESDVVQQVPFSQVAALDAADGISVMAEPYTVMWSVWLNHTMPPMDNVLVRRALNHATPKEVLNEVVMSGLGRPQNHHMAPTRFWDETVPPYEYNLDLARQLLAEAGYPDGFTVPITLSAEDESSLQAAEILQAEWAQIGVTVDIQPLDPGSYDSGWWGGKQMAHMWSPSSISSDVPDDSEQAGIFFDHTYGWNGFGTGYNSPRSTELVRAAVATADPEERRAIYHQLQRQVMDDAITVALLFSPTVTGVADNVGNFQTLPVGWWRLEQVCFTE